MMSLNSNESTLMKYGSSSIVLGKDHYSGHFPEKPNKLLKITKQFDSHDEMLYESVIRSITECDKYYAIPESEVKELPPTSAFYRYLKNIFEKKQLHIFTTTLSCFYVDYAGSMDMIDSIEKMLVERDKTVWKSHGSILEFANHIIKGVGYLHEKKICHLDIKAENIMIDIRDKDTIVFRIIDFGFSSKEPFTEYINNTRGTPGYFPKYFEGFVEPGLPPIYANDLEPEKKTGLIPIKTNPKLVYKIDTYCLGRTLQYLLYHYNNTFHGGSCYQLLFMKKNKSLTALNKMIASYTTNDVHSRPFIIKQKERISTLI